MHDESVEPQMKYIEVLQYYTEWLHEKCEEMGLELNATTELSFVDLFVHFHSGIERVVENNTKLFYIVDEQAAFELGGAAQTDRVASDLVRHICSFNILNGKPLPESFRQIAFLVLDGKKVLASGQGSISLDDFAHRWLAYEGVIFVRDAFGLNLTERVGGSKDGACDLISEAFERFDVEISVLALRDWVGHKNYSNFRKRCAILTDYFKDLRLQELGVLNGKEPKVPKF